MDNDFWIVIGMVGLATLLGMVFGGSIATTVMKEQAIKHNVGYYNPTNGREFIFVTLTNSPVTINK